MNEGRIGCPQYQAPEVVSRSYYGKGCDIWGAGVLLHVLLSGRLPFLGSGKRLREVISGGRVVVMFDLFFFFFNFSLSLSLYLFQSTYLNFSEYKYSTFFSLIHIIFKFIHTRSICLNVLIDIGKYNL